MAGITNNTFTTTKQIIEKDDINERGLNRIAIINLIFRYESLIDDNNKVRTPDSLNLDKIAEKAKTSKGVVLLSLIIFLGN